MFVWLIGTAFKCRGYLRTRPARNAEGTSPPFPQFPRSITAACAHSRLRNEHGLTGLSCRPLRAGTLNLPLPPVLIPVRKVSQTALAASHVGAVLFCSCPQSGSRVLWRPIAKKLCWSVKSGFRRTGRLRHAENLFRSAASDCYVRWGGPSEACDSGVRRGPAGSTDMQLPFGTPSVAMPSGAMVPPQLCDGRRPRMSLAAS